MYMYMFCFPSRPPSHVSRLTLPYERASGRVEEALTTLSLNSHASFFACASMSASASPNEGRSRQTAAHSVALSFCLSLS